MIVFLRDEGRTASRLGGGDRNVETVVDEVLLIDPQLCPSVSKTTEPMWTSFQKTEKTRTVPHKTTIVLDRILIKAGPTLSS